MRRGVQHAANLAFAGGYAVLVLSGVWGLAHPVTSYDPVTSTLVVAWSVLQLAAAVPLVAVAMRSPIWEWRALPTVIGGIACYAVVSWVATGSLASHGARAADITALTLFLTARFFVLWQRVLDAEAIQAAREGGRWD